MIVQDQNECIIEYRQCTRTPVVYPYPCTIRIRILNDNGAFTEKYVNRLCFSVSLSTGYFKTFKSYCSSHEKKEI
jgi:hypothetical protein